MRLLNWIDRLLTRENTCKHGIVIHFTDPSSWALEIQCSLPPHSKGCAHGNHGWVWRDNALLIERADKRANIIQTVSKQEPHPWVMYPSGKPPELHKDDNDRYGTPYKPEVKRLSKKEKRKVGQSLDEILRATE